MTHFMLQGLALVVLLASMFYLDNALWWAFIEHKPRQALGWHYHAAVKWWWTREVKQAVLLICVQLLVGVLVLGLRFVLLEVLATSGLAILYAFTVL